LRQTSKENRTLEGFAFNPERASKLRRTSWIALTELREAAEKSRGHPQSKDGLA
jgi:hypothetical protein